LLPQGIREKLLSGAATPTLFVMHTDLHCHSTASDGSLPPQELVDRAAAAGIDMLAITDHDTTAGYDQISAVPDGLKLIAGIELSSVWQGIGIHIVGLNIDPAHPAMQEATALQDAARRERATLIIDRLRRKHRLALDEAELAEEIGDSVPGRLHIAQHMVAKGHVKNIRDAFKKYLGNGKTGDVKSGWADPATVTEWITRSGGIAVLAHPTKYPMTFTKLSRCIDDFAENGGGAIEVVSGKQDGDSSIRLTRLCNERGLAASRGSDFHHPGQGWAELGEASPLPAQARPVWEQF